jgi:16S rRNA G966 N2-methylase RsmD
MQLTIDKALQELIPPLTQEEFTLLQQNIESAGTIHDAILYFENSENGLPTLLDGHNRYKIAQETGICFDTKRIATVHNTPQAMAWMLTNQLGKRNLTDIQKVQIALKHKPLLEQVGKERQNTKQLVPTLAEAKPHSTRTELAKIAGVGHETIRKVEIVNSRGEEDLKRKMDAGKVTPHEAYKETLRREGSMRKLTLKRDSADIETRAEALPAFEILANPVHQVEVGQWWELGRHTLYVGDSSLPAFCKSLSALFKNGFDFAFADPPYGADIAEWDKEFVWNHDYLTDMANVVCVTPGHWAIHDFHKATNMPYKWTMAYWVKNGMSRGAVGLANFNSLVLFSKGSVHRKDQDFMVIETTVKPTQDAYETPFKGRKPMEVMMRLLDMFVKPFGLVLDVFGGSGTTLLAAEAQGKTCVMAEILPAHASQIIQRFEALTNTKAQLMI